jgi:phage terminase large subunit-like protein
VRLACERHLRDRRAGAARGLRWDPPAALRAITFFEDVLVLAEGEFAGQAFRLQPWQQFIVGSLFGWHVGAYRRFNTAYLEIGKGNGKSPMAAGIGLYCLTSDGEAGAQVFSAATTRDQAKIVWSDAARMVAASPELRGRIVETVNNLAYRKNGSFFRPVSADASSAPWMKAMTGGPNRCG